VIYNTNSKSLNIASLILKGQRAFYCPKIKKGAITHAKEKTAADHRGM
jgi:hypothetical protein